MRIRSAQVYRRARRCFENEQNLGYLQFYNPQNETDPQRETNCCKFQYGLRVGGGLKESSLTSAALLWRAPGQNRPRGAKSIDFDVGGFALEGPWSKQAPGG